LRIIVDGKKTLYKVRGKRELIEQASTIPDGPEGSLPAVETKKPTFGIQFHKMKASSGRSGERHRQKLNPALRN